MKKIVGILAVAAVATSLFAADVAATVGLSSTLLKTTSGDDKKTSGNMEALTALNDKQTADYATLFSLQFSSDEAGGGVKYWDNKEGLVKLGNYNVWFKPMDNLKLSFNENGLQLFGDKFNGYYAWNVGSVNGGYGIEYTADAVTVNFNLCPTFYSVANVEDGTDSDGNPKYKAGDAVIGELGAKVTYAADFGTIAVLFDAAQGPDKDGKNKNFNSLKIAAGFSGTFSGVNVVANVGYAKNVSYKSHVAKTLAIMSGDKEATGETRADQILATLSAGGNVDAFGYAVTVPVVVSMQTYKEPVEAPTEIAVGLQASGSYNINGIGLKAYFKSNDLLSHNVGEKIKMSDDGKKVTDEDKQSYFAGNIGVEVTGSVGAASWKVNPDVAIDTTKDAKSTVFAVGFETQIAF